MGRFLRCGPQFFQVANAVAAQAVIQPRVRQARVEKLAHNAKQVIQGQLQGTAQVDGNRLLRRRQCRLQPNERFGDDPKTPCEISTCGWSYLGDVIAHSTVPTPTLARNWQQSRRGSLASFWLVCAFDQHPLAPRVLVLSHSSNSCMTDQAINSG